MYRASNARVLVLRAGRNHVDTADVEVVIVGDDEVVGVVVAVGVVVGEGAAVVVGIGIA